MIRPLTTLIVLLAAAARGGADASAEDVGFFENRIRPVLAAHCYECHSDEAKRVKGGLKLDTKEDFLKGGTDGAIVVAGKPDESALIKAVRYEDEELQMPPRRNGGKKLPDAAIADLTQWVRMGAPYPETPEGKRRKEKRPWAFDPIKPPVPPPVKNPAWPATSIDSFVLAKIEQRGLQPAPPADKRTLIRRATFDLTGLPPAPEEIEAFLADPAPDAFAKVVDRLLNSRHYGEHWGRHWLDVVRYADTAGDTADYPLPEAWRYRNYVIDSFNSDKRYDVFVQEQIAGDIMARSGPRERYAEQVTATGYLALSRRFGFDSENYHHLTIQDTIDTMGQSILGLTLGCARCHDHKFDPVTAREYYGLFGIFDSTRYSFPGSEQKGRYRAMVPLSPPEESRTKWRELDARFAALGAPPASVLRSLDDMDGDFEMQHVASGGSNGVLVPPWFYEGNVSVTQQAQSPFKHRYAFGTVGVSVAGGNAGYRVEQGVLPRRTSGVLHVNMDFRVAKNNPEARGRHRLAIGTQTSPATEIFISSDSLFLNDDGHCVPISLPRQGQWHNLQLTLDLDARTFSGSVGVPGEVITFQNQPFVAGSPGGISFIALDSDGAAGALLPGFDFDNVAVQEEALAPVSVTPPGPPIQPSAIAALTAELEMLAGFDGDLELQKEGTPPAKPWNPGPNSAVKVSAAAQSPFRNQYPVGKLGIHLPNSGDYNGFGLTLPKPWSAKTTERLFVSFDFRCASVAAGGAGSWRYYIGHGPGGSAAVELYFNGSEFFRRSGDAREAVRRLTVGEWCQVQLSLDLKQRTYSGVIASASGNTSFAGEMASGWDGAIDYTFIDSFGHVGGVKPSLDADNFVIVDKPLPPFDAAEVQFAGDERASRQAKIEGLRARIAQLAADENRQRQELNAQLADGPVALAYGVSEGTPHDSRIQIRGEPEKRGDVVPRGFLKALGGDTLPPGTAGSGRLELARWLTRPENPLTARVMVNRIWQYHFGRGLVLTPNDFGNRSEPPTHPELLDHLASEFVRSGWSIKAMHRLILLSATYRQAARSEGMSGDATAVYAAFPRMRLSAEEIRDSILFVSGELDSAPGGGHPFPPSYAWGFTQHAPFNAVYDHNKRSVYLMVQRIKRHPFLALFDGADPNSSTAERRVTTVPTQALYFLNDSFVHAKALQCARRIQAACVGERDQVDLACRLALGRSPTDEEHADAVGFLAAYRAGLTSAGGKEASLGAMAAYVRTLFGSNEFLHLD